MYSWLRSLIYSPDRDAERLYKDAVIIIESDRQTCSDKHLQRIAQLTQEEFARISQRLTDRPQDRVVINYDLRQQHKNARTRRDNAMLSAMTLVLIHSKAKDLGVKGDAARQVIENFINDPLAGSGSDNDNNDHLPA